MRYLLFISTFIMLFGCERDPGYPSRPNISFKSIKKDRISSGDSITITIRFKDGEGDLGLAEDDTTGKFARDNKYYHNYFVTMYEKQNGKYQEFSFPDSSFNLNGRFPPLTKENHTGSVEGDLTYGFQTFSKGFLPQNDTVKFDIFIVDRQLHESNTIETSPVILNKQ